MKRMSYKVILQSQLGPRTGELVMQEESGVVSGYFHLVGHRSGFTGSVLAPGKYLISGALRTPAGTEPYDALFTVQNGRLAGGVVAGCGCWDLSGVRTGAFTEQEQDKGTGD